MLFSFHSLTSSSSFLTETLCPDGLKRFGLHREWGWKGLLMMDIVGENMVRKTSLEPCTPGNHIFNILLLCLYSIYIYSVELDFYVLCSFAGAITDVPTELCKVAWQQSKCKDLTRTLQFLKSITEEITHARWPTARLLLQ